MAEKLIRDRIPEIALLKGAEEHLTVARVEEGTLLEETEEVWVYTLTDNQPVRIG